MYGDIDDEMLYALGGERLIITLDVAELAPGTYIYLDTDDEIIMEGTVLEPEPEPEPEIDDAENGVPPALPDFGDTDLDEQDTDPVGRTFVGPPMAPRMPGPVTAPLPARATTIKGPPVQLRSPVPEPDQILNETNDDYDRNDPTAGPPITPRRPVWRGQ